jgi:4-hydroxy-tetrahydrodipicolinate synthase
MTTSAAMLGGAVTPFDDAGALDERLLRDHLRFIADAGSGVYLCGHGSGEGDLLTHQEKLRVYRVGVDELGGEVPVSAFVAHGGTTSEVIELAKQAEDTGVDAIQIVAPRPGPRRPRDEEIEGYFREVIESVACDVHVNDNASLAGYTLPVALLDRLVGDYAHVRAVNLSLGLPELTAKLTHLKAAFGDRIAVRAGITPAVATVHALGGSGLLCFEPNVAPRLTVAVWEALERGQAGGGDYVRLLQLNMVLSEFGNPRSLKAALRVLGRDAGIPRKPYLPLPPADAAVLASRLAELDLGAIEKF